MRNYHKHSSNLWFDFVCRGQWRTWRQRTMSWRQAPYLPVRLPDRPAQGPSLQFWPPWVGMDLHGSQWPCTCQKATAGGWATGAAQVHLNTSYTHVFSGQEIDLQTYFLSLKVIVFKLLFSVCPTDVHSSDSLSLSSQRDDYRVRVLVCVADLRVFKDVSMWQFIGSYC